MDYSTIPVTQLNNRLAGATFSGISVSRDGESTLRLDTDRGHVFLSTEGDCCSESWWADVLGAKSAMGARIESIVKIELPNEGAVNDGRTRQESDQAYGMEIRTTAGVVSCIFRNSSNGYYGGSCDMSEKEPKIDDGWQSVTTDAWQPNAPAPDR